MSELRVENIIAASHIGKEVELIRLATELPKARYSGSGNPSVIVDINAGSNKRAAGIIFGNGKLQITGVTSLKEGRKLMMNLKKMVKNIDSKVKLKSAIKVENVVAKADLGNTLNLQSIALATPGSEYDLARFKGLVIRIKEPLSSFILFQSGIVIVTDVISEAKAKKALLYLENFLKGIGALA